MILACDGIWDVSTCENAHEFVTAHLKVAVFKQCRAHAKQAGLGPKEICERLLDNCLNRDSKVALRTEL